MLTKTVWRKRLIESRKAMPNAEKAIAEEKLLNHFLNAFDWQSISVIYGYWGMERFNETNTVGIFASLLQKYPHLKISMPRMVNKRLVWHFWKPTLIPVFTNFGVPEPDKSWPICFLPPDLICIPLLAINPFGYRIGYGKGFYDRFLSENDSRIKLGFSHNIPIVHFDAEPHDVACNYILDQDGLVFLG